MIEHYTKQGGHYKVGLNAVSKHQILLQTQDEEGRQVRVSLTEQETSHLVDLLEKALVDTSNNIPTYKWTSPCGREEYYCQENDMLDMIEEWHKDNVGYGQELHEYLNMSLEDFGKWCVKPSDFEVKKYEI